MKQPVSQSAIEQPSYQPPTSQTTKLTKVTIRQPATNLPHHQPSYHHDRAKTGDPAPSPGIHNECGADLETNITIRCRDRKNQNIRLQSICSCKLCSVCGHTDVRCRFLLLYRFSFDLFLFIFRIVIRFLLRATQLNNYLRSKTTHTSYPLASQVVGTSPSYGPRLADA